MKAHLPIITGLAVLLMSTSSSFAQTPPPVIIFNATPTLSTTLQSKGAALLSGGIAYSMTGTITHGSDEMVFGRKTGTIVEAGQFLYGVPVAVRSGASGYANILWCAPTNKQGKWVAYCFGGGKDHCYVKNTTSPFLFDQATQAYAAIAPDFAMRVERISYPAPLQIDCAIYRWKAKSAYFGCAIKLDGIAVGGEGIDLPRLADGSAQVRFGSGVLAITSPDNGNTFSATMLNPIAANDSAVPVIAQSEAERMR